MVQGGEVDGVPPLCFYCRNGNFTCFKRSICQKDRMFFVFYDFIKSAVLDPPLRSWISPFSQKVRKQRKLMAKYGCLTMSSDVTIETWHFRSRLGKNGKLSKVSVSQTNFSRNLGDKGVASTASSLYVWGLNQFSELVIVILILTQL